MTKRERKNRMEQLMRKTVQAANMAALNMKAGRKEEAVEWCLRASFYTEARILMRRGAEEPEYKGQTTKRGAALRSARKRFEREEDRAVELQFA